MDILSAFLYTTGHPTVGFEMDSACRQSDGSIAKYTAAEPGFVVTLISASVSSDKPVPRDEAGISGSYIGPIYGHGVHDFYDVVITMFCE